MGASFSGFYIDFAKAFDGVSHEKLFAGLYAYGVCGTVLLWIKKNFFSARTRQTKVDSFLSDTAAVISEHVQGSGIGPLMFLLYINELAIILDICDINRRCKIVPTDRGGSRKKYWGAGPSSFGRQQRLSEITIEPITSTSSRITVSKITLKKNFFLGGGLCPSGPNVEPPLPLGNV